MTLKDLIPLQAQRRWNPSTRIGENPLVRRRDYKSGSCGAGNGGARGWAVWGALLGGGWPLCVRVEVSRGGAASGSPLTPNCSLSLHRASWVFLVCLAILDVRDPR